MAALVQDLVKKGLIAQPRGIWALTAPLEDIDPGVPDTLQQMLDIQIEQLSAEEQRVLESGSVVENVSRYGLLRRCSMPPWMRLKRLTKDLRAGNSSYGLRESFVRQFFRTEVKKCIVERRRIERRLAPGFL